jgi:lipopolysaccharide export LptBFGC system permease protein LptF
LAYYAVTLVGVSFARQGRISPALGAWLADVVFFLGGAVLAVAGGAQAFRDCRLALESISGDCPR